MDSDDAMGGNVGVVSSPMPQLATPYGKEMCVTPPPSPSVCAVFTGVGYDIITRVCVCVCVCVCVITLLNQHTVFSRK